MCLNIYQFIIRLFYFILIISVDLYVFILFIFRYPMGAGIEELVIKTEALHGQILNSRSVKF